MVTTTISITENDIADKALLLRALKKVTNQLVALEERIAVLESAKPPMSIQEIRAGLQAGGTAPLNVTSLPGKLADPQWCYTPIRRANAASVLPLDERSTQQYGDGQLVIGYDPGSIPNYAVYRVKGGSPKTLEQIYP